MRNNWVGIAYIVIISQINVVLTYDEDDDESDVKKSDRSQVEVRAVFINCKPEVLNVAPESEATRFQRDELFKHSVLKDCTKKLCLTVKITSQAGNSGDEYLPVEHVFEDSEKRVRLLDPYILRLRREIPRQAYLLRRLDTVSCVVTIDDILDTDENRESFELSRSRIHREVEYLSEASDVTDFPTSQIYNTQMQSFASFATVLMSHNANNCDNRNDSPGNNTFNNRYKRNERNIVVEKATDDSTKYIRDDNDYRASEHDRRKHIKEFDEEVVDISDHKSGVSDSKLTALKNTPKKLSADSNIKTRTVDLIEDSKAEEDDEIETNSSHSTVKNSKDHFTDGKSRKGDSDENDDERSERRITKEFKVHNGFKKVKGKDRKKDTTHIIYSMEKDYAVYEIGAPDLWHTVHVQLFEKLSTPEGKTVWNDLTKGEVASVGSTSPEWTGPELNVRYRSTKWMPREDFDLPSSARLCLLVPINDGRADIYADNSSSNNNYDDSDYIVIPREDIFLTNGDSKLNDVNLDTENAANFSDYVDQSHRRITIRSSRAVLKGNDEKLSIASHGSDKYLTFSHRQPVHAQIDLEARADENQLVLIGSSGRISIAVSDNTRKTRSTLSLQIGNTGLAAARFRVIARDCYPLLVDQTKSKEVSTAGPILIPPRHTRSLRLEIPFEMPADDAHCSISLMNDDGQSVAVRDVTVKKGDRCFCVWHCDCVCLSVDPKLICRDMDEARQKAAGLSIRNKMRHTRSVCYQDDVPINICTVLAGVMLVLLAMGVIKATLGLVCSCVGTWGLRMILRVPRKLDHYYEKTLCCREVVYDEDGFPIHPDTKERTVHLVSMYTEFVLNIIFFICLVCLVIYDLSNVIRARYSTKKSSGCRLAKMSQENETKDVFSSHDIQELAPRWRRRREGLRRWMTPQAQELSAELWHESFKIRTTDNYEFMRPLLRENVIHDNRVHDNRSRMTHETPDSCIDSEQDDTEYVLTQMQKSRESLARSQKKISNLDPSSHAALSNMELKP